MDLNKQSKKVRSAKSYVIEAATAVLTVYFLLGGSQWSALGWAVFVVVTVWIVVREVRREAGVDTEEKYRSTNSTIIYSKAFDF
ncbi:MAG: hypothetical protein WD425_13285 [Nitrospirales bacterium]